MATSGTYSFNPSQIDLVLDAFERIDVRPAAITPDHMLSARRSINLLQVRFANKGINLWAVDEITVPLVAGVQEYDVPQSTVTMLETWIVSYQLGSPISLVPDITTVLNSSVVTIRADTQGQALVAGQWIAIPIYVSIGGVVVSGFYQIRSVQGPTTITVDIGVEAASSSNGGVVPQFTTTVGSETVSVSLPNHGFLPGQTFVVQEATLVGGVQLQGDYTVLTVPDTSTLTFSAANIAGSAETVYENDGQMQIAVQVENTKPVSTIMTPISRTDWAALAVKDQPMYLPTSYWYDRTDPPTVRIWGAPTLAQPQELHYFRMRQLQDGDPQGTQTPDIPYRFEECFSAGLAYMLAIKWNKVLAADLKTYFDEVWAEAMSEDRERVMLNISPQLDSYYR